MLPRRFAASAGMLVLLAASAVPAAAESGSQEAQDTALACATQPPPITLAADRPSDSRAGRSVSDCTTAVLKFTNDQGHPDEATNQLNEDVAVAEGTQPGDLVVGLAGQVAEQWASTLALQTDVAVDITGLQIHALQTPTLGGGVHATGTNGFTYVDDIPLTWDPNDPKTGASGHLDGYADFSYYKQSRRYETAFDYWATNMWSSVTPLKGAELKRVLTEWTPTASQELVDATPRSVNPYGSAGSESVSYTASLDGETGGGSSITVDQTSELFQGDVGGGILHDGSHYGTWIHTDGDNTHAKETGGSETWKIPANGDITWNVHTYASCNNC